MDGNGGQGRGLNGLEAAVLQFSLQVQGCKPALAAGLTAEAAEAVHLDSFGEAAPYGCVRTKCGVILGDRNPRVVQDPARVTCSGCRGPQEAA